MWQTGDGDTCTWRASLEIPGTRDRHGFASLEEMFEFLRDRAAEQMETSGARAEDGVTASSAGRHCSRAPPPTEQLGDDPRGDHFLQSCGDEGLMPRE
jgi:hypothetical protein